MHSRIFEISDKPIPEDERYNFYSVPEWFFYSVADSAETIKDEYRDGEIQWLVDTFGGLCTRDGDMLTFDPETREKFFRARYSRFVELAAKLHAFSFEAFSGGPGQFELEHAMYEVNDAYEDKFGFYVYDPEYHDLQTMHAWLRNGDLSKPHYVGGIVDYHW